MPEDNETSSGPSPRVFLCHSSGDKTEVRNLYQKLRRHGVNPWLDEEDLLPGQVWELEITKAVRSSAIIIVCLSRNSVSKTGYVQKEIKYALDIADEQPEGKIFLIPVRIDDCAVPDRLKRWQWVDLFEPSGFDRLVKALQTSGVARRTPPRQTSNLRLTVHRAFFAPNGPECFFINVTNIGIDVELEVTHIWFETSPPVYVVQHDRPLPKRLKPQETWETWVRVGSFDSRPGQNIYELARARLSTGIVVESVYNEGVPMYGSVPGGPITQT
jgi:hypothetical protein